MGTFRVRCGQKPTAHKTLRQAQGKLCRGYLALRPRSPCTVAGPGETWLADFSSVDFEILGDINAIEPIALGRGIRDRRRLQRLYGKGRGRKLRGVVTVLLADGTIHRAEVHWDEAHGIGRKEFKLKLPLLD